ncbi:MAG TPA: ACP S-malonyltransferase [Terrimicrobiaceae bacterium]|nr:ACP S-malonyltransferase [Terrimicrobiaceae bacterium]
MNQKIALLFAGQGAQAVGMGKDLAAEFPVAASLFKQANEILGFGLSRTAFEGPADELTKTSVCQPALYVHGLACLAVLKEKLPQFVFHAAAGLSLGEFTAHSAAGTFDFHSGLDLVAKRSQAMQEACENTHGSMAAIIGGTEEQVRELASAAGVDVANLNSPGQIVLSGEAAKIAQAVSLARDYGARKAVELQVAGAFHSHLMESAYLQLQKVLADTSIKSPDVPVVCNVDAQAVSEPEAIRRTLAQQVTGSVRWIESVSYLLDHLDCTQFIELGPGGVLAGLVGRIRKGTPVTSISDVASLTDALKVLS